MNTKTFTLRWGLMPLFIVPALWVMTSETLAAEGQVVLRGARVRVSTSESSPSTIGSLMNLERDSLVLSRAEDLHEVVIPVQSIRRLEVSRGNETHRGYAGIGLLAGATAGALIGAALYREHRPTTELIDIHLGPSRRGDSAALGGIIGGILGLFGGMAIGSTATESWIVVDPANLHLSWIPERRESAVALSMRF